ncbi:PREDICTED: C-type lectin domain family 4 member D [Chinchilla lanigera]|uniref:C-type lectin domain family 4 member D n=1 Tax=Chinchilla lanigera TaxID=34839 RepID=A0A8C2VY33_CHILA|nr:PREDICTED: C-type lectin domain family 4 member D [Chinchilla lanigera]
MQLAEPQRKSCQHSQMIPWVVAVVFISLLGACFIASCLVTHHNFRCFRRETKACKLPAYHKKVTCIQEASGQKGGTWICCPVGWRVFQSNCYFPFHDNKTWAESERNCSGMGAHLASIVSEAEQNFTTKILNELFLYFVGLKSENGRGQWHWIDQTPFNPHIQFWLKKNLKNVHNEDCAVLINDRAIWSWSDFPCNVKTSRICKLPGIELM